MRFTITVEYGGKPRSTMTVPAAVAGQIEEAAKRTNRGVLSVVNGVLACGMDGLSRQLERKRMAEEAAARRDERRRVSHWCSEKWIGGRNALVTRTADDAWWLVSYYDTRPDGVHRLARIAKFGEKPHAINSGEAWTLLYEWRVGNANTFMSYPSEQEAREEANGNAGEWCDECEGEGRILRGTDEGDYATCPDCDGTGKACS